MAPLKPALAVVAKQLISVDAGYKQVGTAIIVKIADSSAHPITGTGDLRALSDVGEGSIAVVLEQAVVKFWAGFHQRWHLGAVDEINIEQAVPVVIEQGYPCRHGFGLVLLRGGRIVHDKVHTGTFGNILEPDRRPPYGLREHHQGAEQQDAEYRGENQYGQDRTHSSLAGLTPLASIEYSKERPRRQKASRRGARQ
jgi:hypothetical protein